MCIRDSIYIKDNEYSRAKKLLNTVLHIDKNNTLACKYMDEINQVKTAKDNDASGSFLPRKRCVEETGICYGI